MADLDPCKLITSADATSLGVGSGKTHEGLDNSARGCAWNSLDQGSFSIQVNVFDSRGVKDVSTTGQVKKLPDIGKHRAVQYLFGAQCNVGLFVTETSRVDATAASGNDTKKACQVAEQVAKAVEPKLPGGS